MYLGVGRKHSKWSLAVPILVVQKGHKSIMEVASAKPTFTERWCDGGNFRLYGVVRWDDGDVDALQRHNVRDRKASCCSSHKAGS